MLNQVSILGHTFNIKYISQKQIDKGQPDKIYGDCDVYNREIRILKTLAPDILKATLLHECFHAILGISGQAEMLTEGQEEAIVIALEHGLGPIIGEFSGS